MKTAERIVDLLLERLMPVDAANTFARFGVPGVLSMDKEELRKAYKQLVLKHHPDAGGEDDDMKDINAAYDVLKLVQPQARVGSQRPQWSQDDFERAYTNSNSQRRGSSREDPGETRHGVPIWAWAGHSGGLPPNATIHRNDYSDLNFIKKEMWRKAGRPAAEKHNEYTVWSFDGSYFRSVFTVYGSHDIYKDMAEAMKQWGDRGVYAIFVEMGSTSHWAEKTIWLIWLEGYGPVNSSHSFQYSAFNHNPGNDRYFTQTLEDKLERLRSRLNQYGGYEYDEREDRWRSTEDL